MHIGLSKLFVSTKEVFCLNQKSMQVAGIYSVAGIYTLKKVADNRVVTLTRIKTQVFSSSNFIEDSKSL